MNTWAVSFFFVFFFDEKFPDRCECFSSLKDKFITGKDYLHAIDVCSVSKTNTIRDFHYLYLKTDVSLLAYV